MQKEAFENIASKREELVISISPFPTMFSTLPKANLNISVSFILLSVKAFNLKQSKMLSFGKKLNIILKH